MGFKTQVSVEAASEEEAIKNVKHSFAKQAKSEKWEHPKQVDQGFRAEIKVEIETNDNPAQTLSLRNEFEWVKMNGLK